MLQPPPVRKYSTTSTGRGTPMTQKKAQIARLPIATVMLLTVGYSRRRVDCDGEEHSGNNRARGLMAGFH